MDSIGVRNCTCVGHVCWFMSGDCVEEEGEQEHVYICVCVFGCSMFNPLKCGLTTIGTVLTSLRTSAHLTTRCTLVI